MFNKLKIIEIASVLAGPAVGMFFAELGAEVIKIENKHTGGDVTRRWKLATEDPAYAKSAYYHSVNWGKQSLLLNLKDEQDRIQVYQLIQTADIVIVNFKAGDAEKLGMDYTTLKSHNPQLIYGEITAFGTDNSRVAFDMVLQAESGFLHMNGEPNQSPVKMPVALIDILTAHQLKEGLLIALLKREKTGEGSYVTTSLMETAIASLANQATNWLIGGVIPQRMGSLHPNIAPYGEMLTTKDQKQVVLAVGSDRQFQKLCAVLGNGELGENPLFATNEKRVQNRVALFALLQPLFAQVEQANILQELHEAQVPTGAINNMKEVFDMPIAKGMLLEDEEGRKCVRTVSFKLE